MCKGESHAYIDRSALIHGQVQVLDLKSHGFKLGPGEVLEGRMHVVSNYSEMDWAFSATRGRQCVTAAPLKVIGVVVKGDVVWISIHMAGGGFEREAAFDPVLNLTNITVCTLNLGALHDIAAHALALLHTIPLHQCLPFLQRKRSCVNYM